MTASEGTGLGGRGRELFGLGRREEGALGRDDELGFAGASAEVDEMSEKADEIGEGLLGGGLVGRVKEDGELDGTDVIAAAGRTTPVLES
jgi:hypothetical protein